MDTQLLNVGVEKSPLQTFDLKSDDVNTFFTYLLQNPTERDINTFYRQPYLYRQNFSELDSSHKKIKALFPIINQDNCTVITPLLFAYHLLTFSDSKKAGENSCLSL